MQAQTASVTNIFMPLKSYSMREASETARIGTEHVEAYLRSRRSTVHVDNVEDKLEYRNKDVDLVWTRQIGSASKRVLIEVKVDTYHRTGNYFFETLSNVEKGTPGCFLYSEADYFFYYFLGVEIHALRLAPVRAWFLEEISKFPTKRTTTPVGGSFYHTEGRLVRRSDVIAALPNDVVVIPYSDSWMRAAPEGTRTNQINSEYQRDIYRR